jgi:GT2 family glycosyltransferase
VGDSGVVPSVDIVILSWDRVTDTIEAVRSAITQRGISQTIIVVDQGTATQELARLRHFCQEFSNVKLLTNSRNTGVPAGRNQAAKIGSSEYIVSLDNDAIFKDEYQVQKAVQLLQSDDKLAGLAFRIKIYSDDSDDRVSWPYPREISVWADRSFAVGQVVGAGHIFRRSAFERVSGYDPLLFFMHEELDLGLRLLNAGFTLQYTPLVCVRHKLSPDRRPDYNRERFYYHARNLLYIGCKTLPLHWAVLRGLALLIDGVRLGRAVVVIQAIGGALRHLPAALSQRWFIPGVRLNQDARRRLRELGPMRDMSFPQRFRWYLRRVRMGASRASAAKPDQNGR